MSRQRMLHLLPVEAYTSQEWFDKEQEKIFSRTWRYAGFMEDITEPGQYMAVQAGLNNIFIVMGRDRRLRAFHNICRHRGTQLIRAVGKTQKALTCPYHDWTYDLDGTLISVPEEDTEYRNLDKSCLGLMPASVDLWRGMIFVHPDPDAGSIMEWFGDIDEYMGPHDIENMPELTEVAGTYDIKANWKIVVENYIDVYHLSHLHSGTLHMYDHSKAEYGFVGPHYTMWEPPSDHYWEDIEKKCPTPMVLSPEDAGAWVPMLFPGFGLSDSEDSCSIFAITPLAPDLTRVEHRERVANAPEVEFLKQARRSHKFWADNFGPKYDETDAESEDDPMMSGDFTTEDIYACEQQQKSLQSPHFNVGPAAVGESPVVDHQKVVIEWMNKP